MGKKFYQQLKDVFRSSDSPHKMLRPTQHEVAVQESLMSAMVAYKNMETEDP